MLEPSPLGPPNIVLVLMDDFSMDLLQTMRNADRMARNGASFRHSYVVDSLCCVSRASLFTGQYPHQHRVLTNTANLPNPVGALGGWQAFRDNGNLRRSVNVSLHRAGYVTGFVGKYLNEFLPTQDGLPRGAAPGLERVHRDPALGLRRLGLRVHHHGRGLAEPAPRCRPRLRGPPTPRRTGRTPTGSRRGAPSASSAAMRRVRGPTSSRWRRTRRTTGWGCGAGTTVTRCSRRRSATGRTGAGAPATAVRCGAASLTVADLPGFRDRARDNVPRAGQRRAGSRLACPGTPPPGP